ncbi:hypothetical protein OS493_030023 [Desmophyllum pertusum]|uniref:Uncharacterized protein n=1 Tax=Desmophyllum pertusum TaxID=174260 RepID=A0A9W9ZK53_9CNID|nr:hypothetical protein OS493_030023 [Desmophyllum pertusum]
MPPRKRPAAKAPKSKAIRPNKRANRARVQPEVPVVPAGLDTSNERAPTDETRPSQGTVSMDVGAITSTISAVISQAIKTAFSADNLATILGTNANQQVVSQDTARPVDKAVDADVADLTLDMNSQSGNKVQGTFARGRPVTDSRAREPNAEELGATLTDFACSNLLAFLAPYLRENAARHKDHGFV